MPRSAFEAAGETRTTVDLEPLSLRPLRAPLGAASSSSEPLTFPQEAFSEKPISPSPSSSTVTAALTPWPFPS